MKPLRIGILTPTFLPKCSGAEIFHHNLATHLVALGHVPVVMAPRSLVRRLHERSWNLPYEVVGYPANYWSYFKHSARAALWMNRRAMDQLQSVHRFDVWHGVVLYPSGVCLAEWQHVSGVPGLVRAVGDDVNGLAGISRPPAVTGQLRESLPKAQALVALSRGMAADLVAMGVAPERTHVVPNAVDSSVFTRQVDRVELRQSLGLRPDDFVFLCVARNHPQKDFPTLFRACRQLADRHPERRFALAIAGRGARDLRDEVDGCGLTPRVHLFECSSRPAADALAAMPPQKLVDLYLASDAFILPSVLEGFSSAILEAMAASLPIIATAAPGIVDQVRDGREGILVPCGDDFQMASVMNQIMTDADLRGRLGACGAVSARCYGWPVITNKYVELYGKLMARAPAAFTLSSAA